jgi:hypothetical protein
MEWRNKFWRVVETLGEVYCCPECLMSTVPEVVQGSIDCQGRRDEESCDWACVCSETVTSRVLLADVVWLIVVSKDPLWAGVKLHMF